MTQPQPSLYDVLQAKFAGQLQPQLQRKSTLTMLSHALEDEVLQHKLSPVIFAAFQDIRYYRYEQERYDQLRTTARSVTLFGRSLSQVAAYDHDWFVVINEPRFKAVLASKELSEISPGAEGPASLSPREALRPFLGLWSYDRKVVDYASQFLAAEAEENVLKAVAEVVTAPYEAVEQLRSVHGVTDRILSEMEHTNRRAISQINHNQQLLSDLEQQAERLQEVDEAKQLAETQCNTLHHELRHLYNELTRSQTVMTQAVIDKARLEQAVKISGELFHQLATQLASDDNTQALQMLTKIQQLLKPPSSNI